MSMLRLVGGLGLVGVLTSCGASKPPAVAATPPVATSSVPVPAAELLAPISPVSAPPELFAVARAANTEKVVDTAVTWSGLPINWRDLLSKQMPGFEGVAQLGAPVDFAAMLDPSSGETPRVFWAFSIGVASTDSAANFFRQQGWRVTSDVGGAFRIQNEGLNCVDLRALGASPARVVCSEHADGAEALAPYMARGLPTETFGTSEIHAHVVAEPFRRRYGAQLALVRTVGVPFALREVSLDHPKFDRALRDALYAVADDLVALAYDLNRIDIDATITPQSDAVDLGMVLALSGQRSFWGQSMARAAGKGGPPPDVFWKLPAAATSATYSAYSDPEHLRPVAASLRELLDGWLDYEGLPEARRTPLVTAFEASLTIGAKSAYASLPVDLAPSATGPSDEANGVRDSIRAALGNHVFVIDHGGDNVMKLASEVIKSMGSAPFRAQLVKKKLLRADEMPTAKERAPKGVKGLPAGSKAFELTIPGAVLAEADAKSFGGSKTPAKPSKEPPLSVVLLAVPDGDATWFAFGNDEKALGARLVEIRGGTGATLDKREGLTPLRGEVALSAGFSSLAAVVSGIQARLGRDLPLGDPRSLDRLPHRGETPILWHITSDTNGPRTLMQARVPRLVVDDIVALATSRVAGALAPAQK